jgi:1-acyl-sn-glycerol-3-phosphate acyltransferase
MPPDASTLRATVRAVLFLALTGVLVATYPVAIALGTRVRQAWRRVWCLGTSRIMGVRAVARGAGFAACPTVLVPNHVSYLDVLVLGSFTDATFIGKSEIDGWPLFGFLARVTGTMFVRRHWRQAKAQRDAIAARMREGESFVLFAEGTSSNGLTVKPFKTTLLSVAEPWVLDRPVAAQGVTLAYVSLADGRPFTAANCDHYAWYDEMPFAPHLWDLMRLRGVRVEVEFHEPVLSWAVASRKALGPALRAEVAGRLAALRGDALADAGVEDGEDLAPAGRGGLAVQ